MWYGNVIWYTTLNTLYSLSRVESKELRVESFPVGMSLLRMKLWKGLD